MDRVDYALLVTACCISVLTVPLIAHAFGSFLGALIKALAADVTALLNGDETRKKLIVRDLANGFVVTFFVSPLALLGLEGIDFLVGVLLSTLFGIIGFRLLIFSWR